MKIVRIWRSAIFVAILGIITAFPYANSQTLAWHVDYDEQGRIACSIDPAGKVTNYSYTSDSDGLVKSITLTPPDGSPVTWQFDNEGQFAEMMDGEGKVVYRYDDSGRLTAVERVGTSPIHYSYDASGRLAELLVGDFYRIAWTYDFLGRIIAIDTPAGKVRYEYQTGQGIVVRSLPNGIKTFWKRQTNGELEEIIHSYFKKPDDASYSVLAKYTYNHRPDGRISVIHESSAQGESVYKYAYDSMGRLVRATESGGRQYDYEYDILGNRTRARATGRPDQVCSYDWAGRLTNVNETPCAYDNCGNLTEITLDGVARQFRYRSDGRLTKVQAGDKTVDYRYDGSGLLISRKIAADETRFIADPVSSFWQPLVIEEPGGVRTLIIWDGATPIALVRNGNIEWLLQDHLGSVRVVTDAQGTVSRYCEYDPFGKEESEHQSSILLAPAFSGLFWDCLAASYLTFARAFNPGTGGFLEPDPQKRVPTLDPEDHSYYLYCGGDPVNLADIDGADSREPVSFNSSDRWWDSWRRTLAYNTIGAPARWVYKYFGGTPTGLALNTDPDERDYIISDVIKEAQRRVGDDPAALHSLLHDWRENPNNRPFQFRLNSVTEHEWKTVENASYRDALASKTTRDVLINDGHIPNSIVDLVPNKNSRAPSRLIKAGTFVWGAFHIIGELTGVPPKAFDNRTKGPWLTNTPATRKAYDYGISAWAPSRSGLNNASTPTSSDILWQRADNLLFPSAYADEIRTPKALSPSPVGGVYLGGAGGVVEGLGALKGVSTDSSGNLYLISEGEGYIKLPPLRLDDIVTVFRSVYLYGEGPTVTIDPNPENPEKSAMIIRHSEATEETYVGWVLYQADRLMKSYNQGVDNITKEDVVSRVPGYADVLDTTYFGSSDPLANQKEGIWERFWIVPAEARRFEGTRQALTLFDVPLKVKTQKMKWEKGQLVDDLIGKSSLGALSFTSWFTANYDSISAEQYLTPPPESGITDAVPVFAELRRIALMTAIAEKLRDQDVPMPFWMHDYEVRKISFEKCTPGMEVTRNRTDGIMTESARIFGGVRLSAEAKAVKTFTAASNLAKASPEIRIELDRSIRLADNLEKAVVDKAMPVSPVPLTAVKVLDENREYQAASVPGTETVALGPCRLDEVDIAIPITGGNDIQLKRSFNSFFNPKGPWGSGWAIDLPRLVEMRVPVERDTASSSYTFGYEVVTPLNRIHARFLNGIPVLGFSNPKAPAESQNSPFRCMAEDKPAFFKNVTTRVLILKDGQEWHFTPHGDLVAVKEGPQVTAYERGADGQIIRIVGLLGGQLAGEIKLEYNTARRLIKSVGSHSESQQTRLVEVTYAYDDAGLLTGVTSDEGTAGYRYHGSWITAITWQDKASEEARTMRSFQYNALGQMLSETADSTTIVHTIFLSPNGVIASSHEKGDGVMNGSRRMVTQYDQRMRLTRAITADGDSTTWFYPAAGGVVMSFTSADQQSMKVIDSPDGSKRTFMRNDAPWITAQFDPGGRLTNLSEVGHSLLTQEWRPDGQLARTRTPAQGAFFQYDDFDLLSSIVLHPPDANELPTEWQQTKLDRRGRPTEVTDATGLHFLFGYDKSDNLLAAVQQTPEGNYGYNIVRDEQDRIKSMNSSWGNSSYIYNENGNLERILSINGDRTASVELADGRLQVITGFDSSRTSFVYHKEGSLAGMLQSTSCPDGLKLEYEYNADALLSAVHVGTGRLVRLEYDSLGRLVTYAWEPAKQ